MQRLERQTKNMIKFAHERRSIMLQFLSFAIGFLIKVVFNMVLLWSSYGPSLSDNTHFTFILTWCLLLLVWTGVPVSYQFFKNWQSFR